MRLSIRARCWFASTALLATFAGCSLFKSSDSEDGLAAKKLLAPPEPPELIRDAVALRGMQPIRVDGVGLVNALAGTGGPVDPSPYREQLVDEMRRNSVPAPNEILESDTNSIVHVRASIPPGARRGDPIDLRVSSPPGSNVTDLQGGWLLDTRLRHQRLIAGRVRRGDVQGMATGAILTRAAFEGGEDESQKTEGVILGGGRVQKDLPMGLVIRPQYKHVEISKQIAKAINARFFFFDGATRRGVAKPVEDDFIELELHPRYEGALGRYVAVVRAIGVNQQQANQHERLQSLAELANNPATAADAALQLEALGESAVPTLLEIIKQDSDELRFYAAEALAYLDRQEAVPVLEELIARESAFRHPALAAMQRLKHPSVGDALHRLFDHPSIETRYGAMATLRRREELLHQLRPEKLGDALKLYQIESQAPPAIVVSVRSEPEIVLFGDTQPVAITKFVFGPSGIIIKPDASTGRLRISRFQVDKSDRRVVVASSVRDLIAGVVAVGGSYGDVVTVLRLAKSKGYIVDQLAIDPLPKPLRTYYRDEASEGETQDTDVEFTGSGV